MERVYKLNHRPGSLRLLGRTEKLAAREAAVEQIKVLLAQRRMCAAEIADELNLVKTTAFAYLRYMAVQLRVARRAGAQDEQKRELWELGEDPTLPSPEELLDQSFAQRNATVPARQLGMWRDPLVAAIHGPALGAAA